MKKVFRLDGLDCANCATKMEIGIKKLKGISDCSVNFMTQRLSIEFDADDLDALLNEISKACRKVDPNCKIIR